MFRALKSFIRENLLFLIIIITILVVNFVKVPYDVEMPGGIINLNDRINIDGKKIDIKGSYNMSYVGMVQGNIPYVLMGLIHPDWDVVKQEENLYEGETISDAARRSKLYLEESKNSAIVAAYKEANIEYDIENKINNVLYIDPKAKTDLKVGDNIISVNEKKIKDVNEIVKIVKSSKIGDILNIEVLRDNKKVNTKTEVIKMDGEAKLGIVSLTTYDVKSEKKVSINTKSSESGPSGGLMMSLIIYNGIIDEDITKGRRIVGTGTIDLDGNVGEIGGVKYKLMGAVKENADVFLVPKDNYKEAMKVKKEKKYKIDIVKVNTLKEAIEYLEGD